MMALNVALPTEPGSVKAHIHTHLAAYAHAHTHTLGHIHTQNTHT